MPTEEAVPDPRETHLARLREQLMTAGDWNIYAHTPSEPDGVTVDPATGRQYARWKKGRVTVWAIVITDPPA